MHAFLFLPFLSAAYVTVAPSTEDNCPSSTQVEAALATHAPLAGIPRAGNDSATRLTLLLTPTQVNGETSFFLIDRLGKVQLYRSLPAPLGDRKRDCTALADSVAFIVDRYLGEMELPELPMKRPPPPPSPPPTPPPLSLEEPPAPPFELPATHFLFALQLYRRLENESQPLDAYALGITLGARLITWGPFLFGAKLGMGASRSKDVVWPKGTVSVIRFPAHLALSASFRRGRGEFFLGPRIAMDLLYLQVHSANYSERILRWPLAGGLEAAFHYSLTNQLFVHASAAGNFSILHKEFTPESTPNRPLFATPWLFLEFSFGVGIHL